MSNLNLNSLCCLLLIISVSLQTISCTRHSLFERVDISAAHISKELQDGQSDQIDSAYKFISDFLLSYRKTIENFNVNIKFYDSFDLLNTSKISARYYLSTSRELLIEIFRSKNNVFTVYGSNYPVQLYIYTGFDPALRYRPDLKKVLEIYDSIFPYYRFNHSTSVFLEGKRGDSCRIQINYRYKFVLLDSSSELLLRGIDLVGLDEKKDTVSRDTLHPRGITMICGNTNLSKWMNVAGPTGTVIANSEIISLWVKSEYFREVLANDRVGPLAKAIAIKRQKSLDNPSFVYPLPEFIRDIQMIKDSIDSYHIKISADSMFADFAAKIRVGTVLWTYVDYNEFEWQLILANSVFFLLVLFLVLRGYINRIQKPITKGAIFTALVSLNGYFFKNQPAGIGIIYWIIPFISMLITYLALFHFDDVKNLLRKWNEVLRKSIKDNMPEK